LIVVVLSRRRPLPTSSDPRLGGGGCARRAHWFVHQCLLLLLLLALELLESLQVMKVVEVLMLLLLRIG
jgi:hypothetical protein